MRGRDLVMWSEGQWEASKKITWKGDIYIYTHIYTHIDGHRDSMKESAKGRFFENRLDAKNKNYLLTTFPLNKADKKILYFFCN